MKFLLNDIKNTLNDNRGIAPLVLAGLGALGGFGLSQLRKKPKKQEINPLISPPRSLTSTPVGASLNEQILAGLKGENIGYPAGFLERTTSPFIEERLARFPEEKRDIEQVYGARGLGRSTLAARDISDAIQQKERDINQILAEATLRDEAQRKADIARIQGLAAQFAQAETQQGNVAAQFDLNRQIQQTALNQQLQQQLQQQRDLEIGLPLSIGGNILSSAPGVAGDIGTGVANTTGAFGISQPRPFTALNITLEDILNEIRKRGI